MKNPPAEPEAAALDLARLARAVRFAMVTFILGLSYVCIRATLGVDVAADLFRDLVMAGDPPPLMQFILSIRPALVAISIAVPLLAVATLFSPRLVASFYLIGMLALVVVAQILVIFYGVMGLFSQIIAAS